MQIHDLFTYTDTYLVGLTQCKYIIMIEPIDLVTYTYMSYTVVKLLNYLNN